MTEEIIETAKAVSKTAEATDRAISALQDAGGFFSRVFGPLIEDSVGLVGDRVKFLRAERAVLLAHKVNERLKVKGIEKTIAVPPKIAIPLIEAATLENDENLHDLWANLLSNAMDPATAQNIRKLHVSVLEELEPLDANILRKLVDEYNQQFSSRPPGEVLFDSRKLTASLRLSHSQAEIALLNLMRLGCIKPGQVRNNSASFGGHPVVAYKGTDQVHISALGLSLVEAVS